MVAVALLLDRCMKRDLISEVMRKMGKMGGKAGGKKGGKARMAALTPDERKALARKAVQTRWAKAKKKSKSPEVRGTVESGFSD